MKFYIQTLNDNGSGMNYNTKEDCLREIGLMIDDCIANGGTYISFDVDSDASCFDNDEDEEETEMSYCDKSNCGYYYKGDDDDFACCHCPDDMIAPCEYDDEMETEDDEED